MKYICVQKYLDIQPLVYNGGFKRGHERTRFSNIM